MLAVDFDLEAPGLDTFSVLSPDEPAPGLVEYVARYLETDAAPDAREFIGASPTVNNLLVMPSGASRKAYASNFGQIDWQALYAERDGYLLFEDLKEQWRKNIEADYVLIDSRTGFTDTGGICTRQLPDAVTVLFFPNEQNLRGLTKVVADVRSEANPPRNKQIELHFVMSNVPDLDDEDDILTGIKERFQSGLRFEEEPLVVHRYDSLSLLNQAVFVRDRPKSRLAREYKDIVDRIVSRNLEDRDGAMAFVQRHRRYLERPWHGREESPSLLSKKINEIESLHAQDGEVLFQLGTLAEQHGLDKGELLLDSAIEQGHRDPEAFMQRARLRREHGDLEGAGEDAIRVLESTDLPPRLVSHAARLIPDSVAGDIPQFPAIASLDPADRIWLADTLLYGQNSRSSTAILEAVLDDPSLSEKQRARARSSLALNLIGNGRSRDAVDLLAYDGRTVEQMEIQDAFNYAMARWALDGAVDATLFDRVVESAKDGLSDTDDANHLQCLAVAYWAVGDAETGREFVERATRKAAEERMIFSCWRYDNVSRREFRADMQDIAALIDGDAERKPSFMNRYDAAAQASLFESVE